MKKRLLLTLLPLAFLVAACSGANKPAASSSQTPNPSTSQPSGDTSSAAGDTSSAAGDDSSEAEPEDERAYDALKEEGVEVGIGSVYYTLESQPADPNMSASYNLKGLSVTEGEKIKLYNDGTAVQAWAQADSDNGIYPNYNERPQSTKYEEFTVTETSDEADMYVHISESTGDFMIWLTPTNDGTEGGGEVDPGDDPTPVTPGEGEVAVSFAVPYGVDFGQALFVSGAFNNWQAEVNYRLTWSDGDVWVGEFALTEGTQFKVVVAPYDGGNIVRYEAGDNRVASADLQVTAWQE